MQPTDKPPAPRRWVVEERKEIAQVGEAYGHLFLDVIPPPVGVRVIGELTGLPEVGPRIPSPDGRDARPCPVSPGRARQMAYIERFSNPPDPEMADELDKLADWLEAQQGRKP